MYKEFIKPLLFRMDPEKVHDRAIRLGRVMGSNSITRFLTKKLFYYEHSMLRQTIKEIEFSNPVGLAAGFDKDAHLMNILHSVGFGHEEIGSITAKPCKGNQKPRLWRLPRHKSLVVYYGLKNDGCKKIAKRLQNRTFSFPIGISIAKTNCKETVEVEKGIEDYYEGFNVMEPFADYLTINISCPNAYGGQAFSDPNLLDRLLSRIQEVETSKPVFIKLSPDLSFAKIDDILKVCERYEIEGFVISNLVKDRRKTTISEEEFRKVGKGGLSGKIVYQHAVDRISYVYQKTKGTYTLIGVGGIFTAKDAYEMITSGASLLQLITGMIYEGPSVIKKINIGLVRLLKRDGFTHISQAVGSKHKS